MFDVVKFRKEHILPMMGQVANADIKNWLENGHAQEMEDHKASHTVIVNGVPAVCGGLVEYWADRGYLWCILNQDFKHNFVPAFRGIQAFLKLFKCRRMELAVPVNFEQGKRRAKLLGFTMETACAKRFFVDGQDAAIFVKVRE